jgi:integrase
MAKLTDAAVKNVKPGPRTLKLHDGGGLFLQVNPNGARYWRLKYRFGGKEKLLALGVYPAVNLKQARERRAEARRKIGDGIDPGAERKKQKAAARREGKNVFRLVALEWIEKYGVKWSDRYKDDVKTRLENNVFPQLGERPIARLEPPELLECLRRIEERGAHEMAHRNLAVCSQIFRYGIASGYCARDPAADLRGALTPCVGEHMAAVKPGELPRLLVDIDGYDGDPVTRLGLRMVAATFTRTIELIGAEWKEFDFDEKIWVVPELRMKAKNEHLVPLSRQTLAVLAELKEINGQSRYVFAEKNPRKFMSNNTLLYALYRLGYKSRMTTHGFRSVASTILNEAQVTIETVGRDGAACLRRVPMWNPDAIERQLAHCERNAVRGAYNRAEYLPERREMMQWWADHLDELRAAGKGRST